MILSLRIYISYHDKILVFKNLIRGELAAHELTKQTIFHIFAPFSFIFALEIPHDAVRRTEIVMR